MTSFMPLLPVVGCWLCRMCSLPAGGVAKVLQAALAAETMPIDAGLEYERCAGGTEVAINCMWGWWQRTLLQFLQAAFV
jgi:hypothetical protein